MHAWFIGLLFVGAADPPALERFIANAARAELVPVEPNENHGGGWCRRGKPEARRILDGGALPADVKPVASRRIILRETGCTDTVFRITVTEWTFASVAEAQRVVEALARSNHNAPLLKSAHRLWREDARIYLADARALTNAARLVRALETLGAGTAACAHR